MEGQRRAEIARVLRPDGQVLVLEHVLAVDPAVAAWQHRLRLHQRRRHQLQQLQQQPTRQSHLP